MYYIQEKQIPAAPETWQQGSGGSINCCNWEPLSCCQIPRPAGSLAGLITWSRVPNQDGMWDQSAVGPEKSAARKSARGHRSCWKRPPTPSLTLQGTAGICQRKKLQHFLPTQRDLPRAMAPTSTSHQKAQGSSACRARAAWINTPPPCLCLCLSNPGLEVQPNT